MGTILFLAGTNPISICGHHWSSLKKRINFRQPLSVHQLPLAIIAMWGTPRLEIPALGRYFSQHRADFSVDDDIRTAVHVGRLAVDNGERGAVRLCDHR